MGLIIVMIVVMMIFGIGKLPHVGKSMGKAIRGLRRSRFSESEDQQESA